MPILDFLDFLTNSIMMPIAALATCYLVVKIITLKKIDDEISYSSVFKRKKLYNIVMRVFAPIFLVIILVSAILNTLGFISL
jgi:transporter